MWEPFIIFGAALLPLILPPSNVTEGNHRGFSSIGYAEEVSCSEESEAVCCVSASEAVAHRHLVHEAPVRSNVRPHTSREEEADRFSPRRSAESPAHTGLLRYGEPCTTDGKGKTTDCYYNGISGDTACHQTWGPSFREIGYKQCNIFTRSYCCVS